MTGTARGVQASTIARTLGIRLAAAVLGGTAGGLAFAPFLSQLGAFPVIGSLIGLASESAGFAIHIAISILIATTMVGLFGDGLLNTYPRGLLLGAGFGLVWWVLGPLLLLPLMLGAPPFAITPQSLISLAGHLVYGAVLALTAVTILRRAR